MHAYAKCLLIAGSLLISTALWAQESYRPPDPDLLAKLSYDSSGVGHGQLVQLCMAITRDGDYRIVRRLNDAQKTTVRFQGKMLQEQFQQLKSLLGSASFRALSGSHGGLVRQDSESFGAEVLSERQGESRTQRLHWLNADGESPFPVPVTKIVSWLGRFDPQDGKAFEYADYPGVCPSLGGLHLLAPSVAANVHP
jgi:hypothetical protein